MSERKKLGPILATVIVANAMIGSGIFMLPAGLGAVGSISIVAWVAAACGALLLGGVLALLAIVSPGTRGLFSYAREAFGPCAGFVSGALYWIIILTACVAIATAVTGYLSVFVPAVAAQPGSTICTVAVIWALVAVNLAGPRVVASLQSPALVLGLAPVLLAAVAGWFFFSGATFAESWNVTGGSFMTVVPRATVMVFWAFLGLEGAIVLSTRVRNPARDVPIATLGGIAVATLIYMAACGALMGILPAATLAKSSAPFADGAAAMFGAATAGLVAFCAVIKASATLGGNILIAGETGECESVLGHMRPHLRDRQTHKVSIPTLLLTGTVLSAIAMLSASPTLGRQFTLITNVVVVLAMLEYAAFAGALFVLGRSLPPARRFWTRALSVAALMFCAWIVSSSDPSLLVWSVAPVAIAVLAYVFFRMRNGAPVAVRLEGRP
ncbi:MAG TPA: amino acid permease [Rhizomicrobium sp.]|jgi:arginine:agmatine antiporter|nr:amino acid permease [Rhizomicrobium sp.]